LLAYVDDHVGLENTLIVFSADHGGPDAPGYVNSLGIPAGYVDPDSWDQDAAIARIKSTFNITGKLFEPYSHPYLYFSADVKNNSDIDMEALESAVVDELAKFKGVSLAVSSTALRRGNLPATDLMTAVINNFHPKRSGDVYIVFEPNWFINDFDGLTVASTHGSPWTYDTHVPIVFAGNGIRHQMVSRPVETVDVAATLAALLGTKPPSGSVGIPLTEVLEK
jgi:arylsulfatase A-like enzyme